jgi:ribosome-interacting GTPase 1
MPANLPPQYFEAEKQYRRAKDPEEKIAALQAMLAIMPKHKGTDKLHAELRRKIAKLSEEADRELATSRRGDRHYIPKEGAGQAALVGLPNVGKSQLLSAVTGASSVVADYPFTTQEPVPGMMKFENIQVQLLDMPAVTSRDAQSWIGNVLRNASILVIVVDITGDPIAQMNTIVEELGGRRIRIKGSGNEDEVDPGQIVKRALIVANKGDVSGTADKVKQLESQYGEECPVVVISAKSGGGLDDFRARVYETLDIIRVYTKAPGGKPEFEDPVILKRGSTLEDAAESVHKDFRAKLKYALVWGSGKYDGQRVKRDHIMQDGDIVELHI